MAKFMVVVNTKFMVLVEAQNACRAEHIVLDDVYHGIKSAQAFGMDEISTDCFKGFMNCCETVSMRELEDWAEKYRALEEQKKEAKMTIDKINEEIKAMQEKILCLNSQLSIASTNLNYYDKMIKEM